MIHCSIHRMNLINKLLIIGCIMFFGGILTIWKYLDELYSTGSSKLQHSALKHTNENSTINYDDLERQILEAESKMIPGLGDYGEAVKISYEEKTFLLPIFQKEALNLFHSDKISYNRSILDPRHPGCFTVTYDKNLPTASVIIIFTDERWSPLMRTVYSVLNRTPENILHEIILVDDDSKHEELKDKLDYYIKTRFTNKVKLYRLKERSGLIKAKLHGAKQASGDILIFLDAHCEVGINWAEPLLSRIKENNKVVAIPVIDRIDYITFQYIPNDDSFEIPIGGFTWSGMFIWIPVSDEAKKIRKSLFAPVRTPTMAGGVYAIDRKYFWHIGSYDEQMYIWGGENLEISFRIWQCGGTLEIIPCSRVGHIFRKFAPYSLPNDTEWSGINIVRAFKVWTDDYLRLLFRVRPQLKELEIGDLSKRIELRKSLNCKNFSWYLKNVYKEKFILDENVEAHGQVRTKLNNHCLNGVAFREKQATDLRISFCNMTVSTNQYFSFSVNGELRREFVCAEVVNYNTKKVSMQQCTNSSTQKWKLDRKNDQIVYLPTGECLDSSGIKFGEIVMITPCDQFNPGQQWTWDNYL